MKPLVIIESPYAGNVEENERYARACVRDSLMRGEAPIASHLLYTQEGVLLDRIPEERALGIAAGVAWYRAADLCVAYCDRGLTNGMLEGMRAAMARGVPVRIRLVGVADERPVNESDLALVV